MGADERRMRETQTSVWIRVRQWLVLPFVNGQECPFSVSPPGRRLLPAAAFRDETTSEILRRRRLLAAIRKGLGIAATRRKTRKKLEGLLRNCVPLVIGASKIKDVTSFWVFLGNGEDLAGEMGEHL